MHFLDTGIFEEQADMTGRGADRVSLQSIETDQMNTY
jgi:hypothetical protein